jgi:phosphate-selective porin OprO/OprP
MSTFVQRAALLACSCSFLVAERALAQQLGSSLADILERHGIHLTPAERAELVDAARRDQESQASEIPALRQAAGDELDAELRALRTTLAAEPEGRARIEGGAGKGFTLISADEDFSLKLTAILQIQASYTDLDRNRVGHGAPPIPPFPAGTTFGGDQDTSNWSVRRAWMVWTGHAFDPKLTYKLQYETGGGNVILLDGWVNYAFEQEFQLSLGQQKSPFGLHQMHRASGLQTIESPRSSAFFAPDDREIGAMGWGLIGTPDSTVFEYMVGIFNGEGKGNSNNDTGQQIAAAVRLEPFGEVDRKKLLPTWSQYEGDVTHSEDPYLQVGAGLVYDPDQNNATGRGVERTEMNVELQLLFQGFSLQGEYYWDYVNPADQGTATSYGYYAQAGYFVLPSELELYGRYDHLDESRRIVSSLYYGNSPVYEVDEYTLGVGYFFSASNPHALKIQAEYVHRVTQELGATLQFDDDIVRAMLTVVL